MLINLLPNFKLADKMLKESQNTVTGQANF